MKKLILALLILLVPQISLAQSDEIYDSYTMLRDSSNRLIYGFGVKPLVYNNSIPTGTPFFDTSTNLLYYWSGSAWVFAGSTGASFASPTITGTVTNTGGLTFTDPILLPAGTAAAKPLAFGAAGTGIYIPSSTSDFKNSIWIGTGGTNLSHTGGIEGQDNVYIGIASGVGNTTGRSNIGIGFNALKDNKQSIANVAIGSYSMVSYDFGGAASGYNTAVGYQSLYESLVGTMNVAIGMYAMHDGVGDYNTVVGKDAGYSVAAGAQGAYLNNVIIGYHAGFNIRTGGDRNVFVGTKVAEAASTGTDNVIIGYDIEPSAATASNEINIKNQLWASATAKALTDAAAAAAAVTVAVPTNGWVAGELQWTATSVSGTDQLVANGSQRWWGSDTAGTPVCGINKIGTDGEGHSGGANTLVCTWTNVISATNCVLSVTCTNDLAGTQAINLYRKMEMPTPAVLAFN